MIQLTVQYKPIKDYFRSPGRTSSYFLAYGLDWVFQIVNVQITAFKIVLTILSKVKNRY
jgi:hypothetical protein